MKAESNFFDWWSDKARAAIVIAQELARASKNSTISVEHFWIGVLDLDSGFARPLLQQQGVDVDSLVTTLNTRIRKGWWLTPRGHLKFDNKLKTVFAGGFDQAIECGHNYVTTGHVLLADIKGRGLLSTLVMSDLNADELRVSLDAAVRESLTASGHEDPK